MATLVKEKRREKKKTKNKHLPEIEKNVKDKQETTLPNVNSSIDVPQTVLTGVDKEQASIEDKQERQVTSLTGEDNDITITTKPNLENDEISSDYNKIHSIPKETKDKEAEEISITDTVNRVKIETETSLEKTSRQDQFKTDSVTLGEISEAQDVVTERDILEQDIVLNSNTLPKLCPEEFVLLEDIVPSAPLAPIEMEPETYDTIKQHENVLPRSRITCMPLEEAVRVFGGKEIDEVNTLNQKEEAIVELGPQCGSDHPLVDLLLTFRTSLISIERERNRISSGYVDEDKTRASLWCVEKRTINLSQRCPCGADVSVRAQYEVARLCTERLPAARLRLEALARAVRDGYCQHQHAALQAHYDVDKLVAEIVQSDKSNIREALLLVLQALQLSDAAPNTFAQALQRWASILSSALLDQADLGQLLFLLHCLFKQTRSVQWAGRIIDLQVPDMASSARLVAILELLLSRPRPETAQECTEECEAWEEVDPRGEGGAVGEGRLRERDLLALLRALPLRLMLARMLLFARPDIEQEDEQTWGVAGGGRGLLRAGCGVRVLLRVLQRAAHAHVSYARLRTRLRQLAAAALAGLAALHLHCRHTYAPEQEERITAELEACFAAGLDMLPDELHALPATLLSDDAARDYCNTLILGLHESGPLRVEALRAAAPAQACGQRVRAVAQAALDRELDHELAGTVLDFLFQVGISRKSVCKGSCDVAAREVLPELLTQHRLHAAAFHMLADLHQVSPAAPALLPQLTPQRWRPARAEVCGVLDEWVARCPSLVPHLLLSLDYTPHTGVALDSQLLIGSWVCSWVRGKGEAPEWAWQVLRALRVHRTQWGLPLEAPPPDDPDDLLGTAYALMASDWGHCLPLVCGPGAAALRRLAAARPGAALRCAGPMLRVLAQSPESVSLTPQFAEVFSLILNSGPNLVQRALGRRAAAHEQLQQLLLEHMLDVAIPAQERSALLCAWLHALWKPGVPPSARAALDAAVRAGSQWRALDAHAAALLQEESGREYLVDAVAHAAHAPLLCEAALRHAHAQQLHTQQHARLAAELVLQRAAGQRIHVDNALKQIGSSLVDDELPIHRCACAALSAAPHHPAHLLLWRLFLHMYLQRPPIAPLDTSQPVGPLFFSGLVKSRTLSQLKKRLQETITYHRTQIEALKTKDGNIVSPSTSETYKEKKASDSPENSLFSTLDIFDLTGACDSDSDDNLSDRDSNKTIVRGASERSVNSDTNNLISYHTGAEKVLREYLVWLEEGEKVRAAPHHADVARFISEQAMETAWRLSLGSVLPATHTPKGAPPAPPAPPPRSYSTHRERAIRAIADVNKTKSRRYRIPELPAMKDEAYFSDAQLVVGTIQKHLTELEKITKEWTADFDRLEKLDAELWELVSRHRVCRPLPPIRRACPQGCAPITVHVAKDEWCISSGAEHGIQENRRRACTAVRRLARARPVPARITSQLHSIGRRLRSQPVALRVAELAAGTAPRTADFAPAHAAVSALVSDVATRFICADVQLAASYLRRWSAGSQQQLCLALVQPARLRPPDWPELYAAILALELPPHVTFTYISKFELAAWADAADAGRRAEVLLAQSAAAARLGAAATDHHLMLLELLGVQSASVARASEMCAHVLRCARLACAPAGLPPRYLAHLAAVADAHGGQVDFDQLGHLLRELGGIFWAARSSAVPERALYAAYAPHVARALLALLRAFVAAGVARTYQPERVAEYAWSALRESWAAWLLPQGAALLPAHADAHADMLARFSDAILMIMHECPGCEDVLLRQVFDWTVRAHLCVQQAGPQEQRAQLAALLAQLATLPWQRQWFHVEVLELCVQVSRSPEPELVSWVRECVQHTRAAAWLCGAAEPLVPHTLARLLDLFTAKQLALPTQTLDEACHLPWALLPEPALAEALPRYFAEHHSPALPYHEAPHFRVLLCSAQLRAAEPAALRLRGAADKRGAAVSQWVRAAAAPTLGALVAPHCAALLRTLADLAPHIEDSPEELEQLLGRAAAVLCMEPAAGAACAVWLQWVSQCGRRLLRAAATAVATLTTQHYFALLGDAVAQALLAEEDGGGWAELRARWAQCPWWESGELVSRGALHAAYAMLHARPHAHEHLRRALGGLQAADVNFASNELIVCVWVCAAGRVAGRADDAPEDAAAARALLARWAEQRRTLLQVVTLHSADTCPTPRQRLLLRLAQCVAAPSEAARLAYEQACEPLLGAEHADARAWAQQPRAALPRLAARLYPRHQIYFKEELEMAAEVQ